MPETDALNDADQEAREEEKAFLEGFGAEDAPEIQTREPEEEAKQEQEIQPESENTPDAAEDKKPAETSAGEESPPWDDPDEIEEDALQEMENRLNTRMQRLAGNFGGLKTKLDQITEAVSARPSDGGAKTPSAEEIRAAAEDAQKFEAFKEDYPEIVQQMDLLENRVLEKVQASKSQELGFDRDALLQEAVRLAEANLAPMMEVQAEHRGWRQTVVSKEFRHWMDSQDEDTQALADSDRSEDAIAMLDKYEAHRKAAAEKAAESERLKEQEQARNERLQRSVAPTRGATTGTPEPSEEDDFIAAFNS